MIVRRAPRQRRVEQPPEDLHGEILEGERRAVKQFEDVIFLADLHDRRDILVRKARVSFGGHRRQRLLVEGGSGEARQDFGGGVRIGQRADGARLARIELRPGLGHVQPAVGREPGKERAFKIHGGGAPAGRNVLHGPVSSLIWRLRANRRSGICAHRALR